jgi:hypothetical protein
MLRRRQPSFTLPLLAFILLVLHLVSWFLVVNPVNLKVNAWTDVTMPANWSRIRDRWEYGYAAGAGLTLAALVAAALSDAE